MKRRFQNLEGAFPLLLIGSVLVVYAAIVANQEVGMKGSHLPLWGLMAGVGMVIVGAGIYSTFLEPTFPPDIVAPSEWVTVPKADWDALRAPRPPREAPRPSPHLPIWWEGPPEPEKPRPAVAIAKKPPTPARAPRRVEPEPAPSAPVLRRTPLLNDLKDALTELETLVNQDVRSPASRRPSTAGPDELRSCADCGRRLPRSGTAYACSSCGHRMCYECASSSREEYTEVRCLECGVRAS